MFICREIPHAIHLRDILVCIYAMHTLNNLLFTGVIFPFLGISEYAVQVDIITHLCHNCCIGDLVDKLRNGWIITNHRFMGIYANDLSKIQTWISWFLLAIPVMRSEYSEKTRAIPWLQMLWLCASPDHLLPLCWLYMTNSRCPPCK